MKAPNEKLIELLFIRHGLQICGPKTSLYAPSTREEYFKGYDASFMGQPGGREILLQFKTPYVRDDGKFTIKIRREQHERLLGHPLNSAFYVSHAFRSVQEINDSQQNVVDSQKFLKFFIAIEVHALASDTNFVQFIRDGAVIPILPTFARDVDGPTRTARNPVAETDHYDGEHLLRLYKDKKLGRHIRYINREDVITELGMASNKSPTHFSPDESLADAESAKDRTYGTFFRNYDKRVPA